MANPVTLSRRTGPTRTPDAALAGTTAESLVLIVAPSNGRFRPVVARGPVDAGGLVAEVVGGRGAVAAVRAPVAANVQGLLTRPGQLVTAGQALAWADAGEAALPWADAGESALPA